MTGFWGGGSPSLYDGFLTRDDRLMSLFQGLTNAGARMATPGLSRGQSIALGLAGLGEGLQSGNQAALNNKLFGLKIGEAKDKAESRKLISDLFPDGMSAPAPVSPGEPGQTVANAMANRLNGQNASDFSSKLNDPRMARALFLDPSIAPVVAAFQKDTKPILRDPTHDVLAANGRDILLKGTTKPSSTLGQILADRDKHAVGSPEWNFLQAQAQAQNVKDGFRTDASGNMTPVGPADLGYVERKAYADARGGAPFKTVPYQTGGGVVAPFANLMPSHSGLIPPNTPMRGQPPAGGAPGASAEPGKDPRILFQSPTTGPESSYDTNRSKYFADMAGEFAQNGRQASKENQYLATWEQIAKEVEQDPLAPVSNKVKSWMIGLVGQDSFNKLGIDNKTAAATALQSLTATLGLSAPPKGQGAVSNFERELYASVWPQLGQIEGGNKILIEVRKAFNDRAKAEADFARKWEQGPAKRLNVDFEAALDKEFGDKPIMSPELRARVEEIASGKNVRPITNPTAAPGDGVEKTIDGKTYVKRNGNWFTK